MHHFISSELKIHTHMWTKRWCNSLPSLVKFIYIIHPHAEDEDVVHASLLGHLNICSVHGANGQSAVQHELHVAGS